MIRCATFIFAIALVSAVALCAEPTTNPAPPVDPAIAAFLQPVEPAAGDSELQQKLKERHNCAVRLLDDRVKEYRKGMVSLSPLFDAARTVAEAKMDLAQNDQDRVKVVEQTLAASKVIEASLEKQISAGFGSPADLDRAKLARLTAEVELLKLKEPKTGAATSPASATTRP